MAKVGVILSGCGVFDGAEIHEATLTLLYLAQAGAEVVCAAPAGPQARVMDHAAGQERDEVRDVFVESARIARGEITPLAELDTAELDALILPGGFGAALNLSDFGSAGAECNVQADVAAKIGAMLDADKPVAALCIAPPILAKVMQGRGVTGARVTIGNDPATAAAIEGMGQAHVDCPATECVVDEANKLVTCPAYMVAGGIAELAVGIEKAVAALLALAA